MSQEYDYDLPDDGAVATPVAPSKSMIAGGNVRTLNRRLVGYVTVGILFAVAAYFALIKQARDSMASTPSP